MRHRTSLSLLILMGTALAPIAARAVEFAPRDPAFPERAYTCRLGGRDVPLGEQRCLRTPQGERLAQCGIMLNMSSWQPSGQACH